MPKLTDLSRRVLEIAGHPALTVVDQAPHQNRVAFWNVVYAPCGHQRALPHTLLLAAFEGKQRIAPCFDCHPPEAGQSTYDPALFPAGQIAAEAIERLGGAAPVHAGRHDVLSEATGHLTSAQPLPRGPGGADTGQPRASVPGWTSADLPPVQPLADYPNKTAGWATAAADVDEYGTDLPARAPVLAACGERLETFGRAEGLGEAQDLLAVVRSAATQEPRPPSRQLPGMSHLGTPCDRKLAARILEGSPDRGAAWRPFVGTAVHGVLDQALEALGIGLPVGDDGPPEVRWLPSIAVEAGGSKGIIDGLDTLTGTLFDLKITGVTKLRELYRGRLLPVYQGQLDLYALGLTLAGHEVRNVAVLALPMAGELEDAAWYSRPADLGNAAHLIARAWEIRRDLFRGGRLDRFDIAEDSCDYCPLKRRGDCPGAGKAAELPRVPITWGGK